MLPDLTSASMFLRSEGTDLFLSIDMGHYVWFRVAMYGDSMLIWPPDASKLGQLVDRGVLPGKTSEGEVALDKLSAEHMKLITSDDEGVLFHWKSPLVLRRISPQRRSQ